MTESFDDRALALTKTQRIHYPPKLWPYLRAGWIPLYAERGVNVRDKQAVLELDGITKLIKL